MPSQLVTDLQDARKYIEEHGWCQNASFSGDRVCLFGAVFAITGKHVSTDDEIRRREIACKALEKAVALKLGQEYDPQTYFATVWQDEPGRTVDEIYEIYDLAAQQELVTQ